MHAQAPGMAGTLPARPEAGAARYRRLLTGAGTALLLSALLLAGSVVLPAARPDRPSPPGALAPGAAADAPTMRACPAVAGRAATIEEGSCPEPVTIDGRTVTVGQTTFELAGEGDLVAVGDWSCDGRATPLAVRPARREIFVFDHWPAAGVEVVARLGGTVGGAAAIVGVSDDPGACGTLIAALADATVHRATVEAP